MRSIRRILWAGAAAALAMTASLSRADVVYLASGQTLDGTVKHTDGGWLLTTTTGKVIKLTNDEVKSVQKTASTAPTALNERLQSLRNVAASMSDVNAIIDRYQKFIDQTTDPATLQLAQSDLAAWQAKKDSGQIKYGKGWIDPADRAAVQARALDKAAQARELIDQGRLKEADPILQQALAIDPLCASAHYLRGVAQLRQDQFGVARKEFEATLNLVPDHVPTLNNLAIALQHVNLAPAGLNMYDRAMIVSPEDRWILSNVAEALAALPQDQQRIAITQRVARRYTEQMALLTPKMAAQGLYPWGSAWVSGQELQQMQAKELEIKTKLDAMSVDFDASQADLKRIEQAISDNNNSMRQIEAQSVRYDTQGRLVQLAYPPAYYTLQQNNQKLIADRTASQTKLDQLRTQAAALQQQIPTKKYTGVQKPIGIEGTPVSQLVAGTTQPATMPATQPTVDATPVTADDIIKPLVAPPTTWPIASSATQPTTQPVR